MKKALRNRYDTGNRGAFPRYIFLITLLLTLVSFPFFLKDFPVLQLKNVDTQEVLSSFPLKPGQPFYIRYTHSIHLTPVLERYFVNEQGDIVVDAVTYDTFGVGMPSELEPGQTFIHENGKYTLGNLNRRLHFFDQRIGQVIANHTLIINDQELPLSQIAEPGSAVRFHAAQEAKFIRLGREVLQWLTKIKTNL